MNEIIPGVLEKEWGKIEEKLQIIKPFARTVHVDLLDGKFAPNLTFLEADPFKPYSDIFLFELHMMVDNPIQYVPSFANAGFKRFLGHIEMMPDQKAFIEEVKKHNAEACLAVDGPTSMDSLSVPLEELDGLLCMTIKAGFSGQSFIPEHLEKVRMARHKEPTLPIEVDGGTNDRTIILSKQAGATRFITTSFLYGSENPEETYRNLEKLVNSL